MNMHKNTDNCRWKAIDWVNTQETVFKWQKAIYSASKEGNIKLVRHTQHKLLNSIEAKLLAVRRVTQDNKGKNTAGVDGVKKLAPEKRYQVALTLKFPTKSSPLRRVWIPKPGKPEKRPLGIPTIMDRCLQALLKIAIEPEWEARFEPNSYGFRPGRNCHDAVAAILNFVQKKPKYVLDADIAKCFDKINHKALLDKIGMKGKYRTQIKYWLMAGVMDEGVFSDTTEGTPQGGVISPLLANIALHGMETYLKEQVKDIPMVWASGESIRPSRRSETLGVVRYADDFVVLHHDLEVILKCRDAISTWLNHMGLQLSPTKTRLSHTLELSNDCAHQGFDGVVGFNFLGFNIKQHKTKHLGAFDTQGKPLGFRTIIIPSKEKVDKYQEKLHDIVLKQGKKLDQKALIKTLNPVIRGWANYFGKSDANTMGILTKMDYLLYLKLRRWAKRVKGTSGKGSSFFNSQGSRNWVFSTKCGVSLLQHIDYSDPLTGYAKVKGGSSPFDENQVYWTKRLINSPTFGSRVSKLMKAQKGMCKWCNTAFMEGEVFEIDHIHPLQYGGKDDMKNLQLLHRHCHDTKTRLDKANYSNP